MIKNKSGVWGEIFAARYLRDNGFEIVTTNYSCHFGEIDIVALEGDTLCFTEVKARNESTLSRPGDAVDGGKQERLRLSANHFMTVTKQDCPARFDVCEVYLTDDNKLAKLNYIKNAFE